jgi:hypothetical protein
VDIYIYQEGEGGKSGDGDLVSPDSHFKSSKIMRKTAQKSPKCPQKKHQRVKYGSSASATQQ